LEKDVDRRRISCESIATVSKYHKQSTVVESYPKEAFTQKMGRHFGS